jgi:hypothetical protein
MTDEQIRFLDDAMGAADDALALVGNDLMKIAEPLRTMHLVTAAQAAIDNGGLSNFFGADFWHDLPYEAIIAAYRLCGATGAANVLAEAAAFFPFDMPHRNVQQRRGVLKALEGDERSRFWELDRQVCGDEAVYDALAAYADRHEAFFPRRRAVPGRVGHGAGDETYYKNCLAIQEEFLGPDHLNVATTLEKLAALYARTNRDGEAEALLKRALAIRASYSAG